MAAADTQDGSPELPHAASEVPAATPDGESCDARLLAAPDAASGLLHAELDEPLRVLGRAETPGERLAALASLLRAAADDSARDGGPSGVLLARCEADASARATLARALSGVFRETSALGLLAQSGLPNDRGLWQETSDRVYRKLLPRPRDDRELARALAFFLPRRGGIGTLAHLSPDDLARLITCLLRAGLDTRPLVRAADDAVLLLATRISALGLTEAMRDRADDASVAASPFHLLTLRTQALLDATERGEGVAQALAAWQAVAADVRAECVVVQEHLESAGVSLDLVFTIDTIEASIARMEGLLATLTAPTREDAARVAATLWLSLVEAWREDSSLRALLRQNLRLLARKVIERAGTTGEHYITTTRREYLGMWASAAGGGLLTALTAAVKLVIVGLGGPLLVEGLLSSVNYAASFVAIQHLGFTLATKQPSMTAAALAGIMRRAGPWRIEELVTHVARIVRSQLAAALSNVLFVAVGAWLFNLAWRGGTGTDFLDSDEVHHVLESLHPWHSLTVLYAALTGAILWLSSLIGGSIENWAVSHRLPAAIAEHRLGERVGADRMRRLSRFMVQHLSGWGVNVSLGILLGMTPVLGKFAGLPLDVRHVTLSTGMLTLAAFSQRGSAEHAGLMGPACFGIALVFVLNLSVSFGLALAVAMRARDVQASDQRRFLAALGRRMLRSPLEFLLPPRQAKAEGAHAG
jgi:site-specific recombinase